jgi:hypothetical protein
VKRTTKATRVAAAKCEALHLQPCPLPAVEAVLRAAVRAQSLLRGSDPGSAAQVLRAWAGMALAVVSRIEYAQAYAAGAAAALDRK